MSRRRFWTAVVPLALLLCLGVGLGVRSWSERHVRRVTGASLAGGGSCVSCHLGGGAERSTQPSAGVHPAPSALAWGPGGRELFVACEGTDEVVVVRAHDGAVRRRLAVGDRPHGLAVSPDGKRLYVALRGEGRVVALDPQEGRVLGSVAVGRAPCGLALSRDGQGLVVANSGSDDISLLEARTLVERVRLAAGREPYAVAIAPDGSRAFVANRLSNPVSAMAEPAAELTVVDLASGRVERRPLLRSAHLSEGVALADDDGPLLVSLVRVRNRLPITQVARGWVMSSGLGLLDPAGGPLRQFPLDDGNRCFADPSGVAVDGSRQRAYVASGGGDCVSVLDLRVLQQLAAGCTGEGPGPWADHLGVPERFVLGRIPVGANPRALLLSPDGERLWVAERLDDALALIDTTTLDVTARIQLGGPEAPDAVHRGEKLFHRAAITFQGQFSCRSCHPDGHVDGLTYDFAIDGLGRNYLDNRSLLGIADTAPFKWNGKNRTLHDQCGPRFARVLTMSDPFPPRDLDDLVAFLRSLPAPGPAPAEPSVSARRGQQVFARTHANDGSEIPVGRRCSTCHRAPLYTHRLPAEVGTVAATDSGGAFDTPHLVGIGASAPYLHDGRARTLEEIWTVHGTQDTHGAVNDLTKAQLNDLVIFLKTL